MSVFVLGSGSCYCGCVYVGVNGVFMGYSWVYRQIHTHTTHTYTN
jgi:hypothetical protein